MFDTAPMAGSDVERTLPIGPLIIAAVTLALLAYTRPWPVSLVWPRAPLPHFIDDNFAQLLLDAEINESNSWPDPVSEVLPDYAGAYLAKYDTSAITPAVRVPGDVERIEMNAAGATAYRPHVMIFSDGGWKSAVHQSEVDELERRKQTLLSIGVRNEQRSSDLNAITVRQLLHFGRRPNPDTWKYWANPLRPPVRNGAQHP